MEKYLDYVKEGGKTVGKIVLDTAMGKKGWKSWLAYAGAGVLAAKLGMKVYTKVTEKDFKDKIVLITGGANGVGKMLVGYFLREGSVVVIWDIDRKGLESTMIECKQQVPGCKIYGFVVDISKQNKVYDAAKRVKVKVGDVDVIVNNAGIVLKKRLIHSTENEIRRSMNVNVMSHFWIYKAFLPSMIERNTGHIVCISSGAGCLGTAGLNTYCASKFAAFGLTESLRLQFKNERVNICTLIVCPYYIDTGMFEGVKAGIIGWTKQEKAAKQIFKAIKERQTELYIPRIIHPLIYGFRLTTPGWIQDEVQRVLGVLSSMDAVLKAGMEGEKPSEELDAPAQSEETPVEK